MNKVVTIYEGKTNFSKLIKRAKAGETIYVGAYGQAQAIIAPVPAKKKINIGVWDYKKVDIDFAALNAADEEIAAEFEASLNRPLE